VVRTALALVLALVLAVACGGGDSDGTADDDTLGTVTITFTGGDGARTELTVELARTAAERGRGLMFREVLPEERGMLFVFGHETKAGFWMKDTKIPLSIAFIASDGLILETQEMEALSEALHRPARAYSYALEVNQGWFERHGLGAGDRVEIPAEVRGE
jgi:uncharacterized membrane protein (UPF0127 family)